MRLIRPVLAKELKIMLSISNQQIEQINEIREQAYCKKIREFCQKKNPDFFVNLDKQEIDNRITSAVKAMKEHGAISDKGMILFALLAVVAGKDFIVSQELKSFLELPGYRMDTKVNLLIGRVVKHLHPSFQ